MRPPFRNALIIGRFNTFHRMHEKLIDIGVGVADNVLVVVGSAQEEHTIRNPFPAMLRIEAIKRVYGKAVIAAALPDMTNETDICHEWGDYLLDFAKNYFGIPDVTIYGNDENRTGWYRPEVQDRMTNIVLPRNPESISATKIRQLMLEDKQREWMDCVPPATWSLYQEMRRHLLLAHRLEEHNVTTRT